MNPLQMELLLGKKISRRFWENAFTSLFRGQMSPPQMKGLLLLATKRGEDASEFCGFIQALRKFESAKKASVPFLLDVCGTGGDGMKTFNISTISGFVIAGAGGYVAKHGNRAVSSKVGSSDLMEALGVRLDISFSRMLDALHQFRFAYFHAPFYHPTFLRVQAIRRELKTRTLFNALGPLVNPIELSYQVIGVSNPQWLQPLAETLTMIKRKKSALIRSHDGMDELSTQEPNDILYVEGGKIKRDRLEPKKLGFLKAKRTDYAGGDLQTNRKVALGILRNEIRGPQQEVVLLNSGFALWLIGAAYTLQEGIERSRWAIRTGKALEVLEAFREYTNRRN